MSEKTLLKAKAYLTAGKIKVKEYRDGVAVFSAVGSNDAHYLIVFTQSMGFVCNCPAKLECAHILAVKMVCDIEPPKRVTLGGTDEDLQKFFDTYPASRPDDDELF